MRSIPSAEFRKVYASLREPVVVTVKGHTIGQYEPIDNFRAPLDKVTTPGERPVMENKVVSAEPVVPPRNFSAEAVRVAARADQARRDAILRKMSKEGR
jgi:hypothetical protein